MNDRRPSRIQWGWFLKCSTLQHRSCWDCDHIRTRGQPNRSCVIFSERHIYGPGNADREAMDEKDMGLVGTVADRCEKFKLASEFNGKAVMVWYEEPC